MTPVALTAGSRLGPYEIVAPLGAGGMGEVYRARDRRLDRLVAIKILPESFAHDPERLARFEREAKTLAALNHPNIGGIHGLEESSGVTALVLELVEGPTVADPDAAVVTDRTASLAALRVASGVPGISVSRNAVLAYVETTTVRRTHSLWVDRAGQARGPLTGFSGSTLLDPQFTPDGRSVVGSRDGNVWSVDIVRGLERRLTYVPNAFSPVISPDGRLAFLSRQDDVNYLFEIPPGAGRERLILKTTDPIVPLEWTDRGRTLLYQVVRPVTGQDLVALSIGADASQVPILETRANEGGAQLSPDGVWMAFESDETGTSEVYVARFRSDERPLQISTGGGTRVRWRADGKGLFYLAGDGRLMRAPIDPVGRPTIVAGKPEPLFAPRLAYGTFFGLPLPNYAVAPDGQRILMTVLAEDSTRPRSPSWSTGMPRWHVTARRSRGIAPRSGPARHLIRRFPPSCDS